MDSNLFISKSQDRFFLFFSGREVVRSVKLGKGCIWKGNASSSLCGWLAKTLSALFHGTIMYPLPIQEENKKQSC